MSSDEGSSGGSPKRSWAAEEKKEQREVSPRGRHHDRVPSVERVVPSQVDAKGQDGEFEAKVPGKDISGDHRDSSPKARDTGSGLVRGTRDGSHDSRARSGSREDRVRDPSGGRSRCSVSRSTPGAAVPMARDTPVGIPTDRDAHSAPPLGRGFQGRKETTQERKRRRSRQKERQAEETARLQRALREAQQRRTPNSFQGGGRRDTGVSWQRTPQHNYTPTGTGVSGQRTPQKYNTPRGTGVSGYMTPQGGCQTRRTGMSSQGTPQQDYQPRETGVLGQGTPQGNQQARGAGVSSQRAPQPDYKPRETGVSSLRTPQPDYKLRETGVSGQRTPQGPTLPKLMDIPTLQQCPIQGCPIRALDIQPHVMLEHVAEVFGEQRDQPRASLAPIRVAALQAQAWMLVGGDLEDLVTHVNRLEITRPHIIGQAVQGQMEEVCREGGRPVPPYFSTAPVNSPGALIDWRVQAAIMGELGDRADAFRGMFRLQGPRAAMGSSAGQIGQAEGGIDPLRSPSDSPPGKKLFVDSAIRSPTPPAFDSHFHLDRGWRQWRMNGRMDRQRFIEMRLPTPKKPSGPSRRGYGVL
ncbi:unnamed protein product [Mytilus edulis]|uniref:Uncharacterized protein n=1 Tax=Mytilus edulis TaxID=6550 RepID=A0A8S3U0Z2_MYTED|nr:unnamed protein product [Mytilus edulis]